MGDLWKASFGSALRVRSAVCAVLVMGGLGSATATASAAASPRADYQLQNTLTSSIGAPPALTDLGPGTNSFATETVKGSSQTVLAFPAENGVQIAPTTGVIPSNTYTIVVLFRFATITARPWQRIVDFKNGTSDLGLYVHQGALELYPHARGATATISAEKYTLVVLTRNTAGTVTGYVDGVEQFSYNDSSTADAVIDANNTLRFFRDNETGVAPGETSAGAVARIQLYDEALTAEQVAGLFHAPGPPGTGIARVSPASLSFAPQPLGILSAPRVLVVTNTGSGSLPIRRSQMTGLNPNDFLLSSDGCSNGILLAGESCSIGVRFAPSRSGERSATLRVTGDDPLSSLNIRVSGTGKRNVKPVVCTRHIKKGDRRRHTRTRCATKRRIHPHATAPGGHRYPVR